MKDKLLFTYLLNIVMSYVISTEIDGTVYCIRSNVEDNCFELFPVHNESDLRKAFSPPSNTNAFHILNWINKNDEHLASQNLSVQPAAKYQG